MDLSAMWAKAQGERELPEPNYPAERDYADAWTADQMRDFATPDPAALQRFAEEVVKYHAEHGFAAIRRHVKGE